MYFEVVFPDDPRQYDPGAIGTAIIENVKTRRLPTTFTHDGAQIFVDLLQTRYKLLQLPREELNATDFLKATRLMEGRLTFTLAMKISFKSIDKKIDEKKHSNKLDKIGNAWLCIFLATGALNMFANDSTTINRLRGRISRSKWLKGVIVAELFHDTVGNWQLRYVRV